MMTAMDGRKREYPEAVKLYESGLSVADVASFYGRTRQAMWEWLKARGVKMRSNLRYGNANHFHRGTRASDRAQNILEKAVLRGLVERKTHCEKCGKAPTFKDGRTGVQAHHPDYNKPLGVMWLCQPCHHDWHKRHRAVPRRERR
jgi:hypothetical protein